MADVSDEWLQERIAAIAARRDRGAFAELFCYLAPRLQAFAQARGMSDRRAAEMARETMLLIWRKAAEFELGQTSPSAWLFAIARDKRVDLCRGEDRAHLAVTAPPGPSDDAGSGPAARGLAGRASGAVREALLVLDPKQRIVLEKAFVEDKTHLVIAAELGLPLDAVRSQIRLALARMRDALPVTRS